MRRFRMRSDMQQGIVVMQEWEDLGCATYQSDVRLQRRLRSLSNGQNKLETSKF